MEKTIYDAKNGLWYELQGDYYIPCLTVPEVEQTIGIWGQRHLWYIRSHRQGLYTSLLISGKLNGYLAEVDDCAQRMLDSMMNQMAAKEGVTERLKEKDQMAWVQRMNNIRSIAEEIVNSESANKKSSPQMKIIFA